MKSKQTLTLAMAALFAALCYIGFSYFRIDIPVGTVKSRLHNAREMLVGLLPGHGKEKSSQKRKLTAS